MDKFKGTGGFIAVISLWTAAFAFAGPEGDAGRAGAFLRYGVGGRALGMGRAFVGVADDASGVFWNPAGLVGASRVEIQSLYSNLYFDSRYSHLGMVLPRPLDNPKNPLLRFLFGPRTAVGFGWVGLGMVDFEQRTATAEFIGRFGLEENAFAASWAREEAGSWGLLRAGVTVKAVNQGFSGLADGAGAVPGAEGRDWSAGADVGATFQPIHAPLFRSFSLRYVLPLRFGVSVQNLIQPAWKLQSGENDPFPRSVRWGLAYRWVLKDWFPRSWQTVQSVVEDVDILTALDWEKAEGSGTGVYFGAEGRIPVLRRRLLWSPRFGFNNQAEWMSVGTGLTVPFAKSAAVRIDLAHELHPDLPNDTRMSMTFQFGVPRDAGFFRRWYDRAGGDTGPLLNIVADYPNPEVNGTVKVLAESDSRNASRYNDLLLGIDRAEWMYRTAVDLLKRNETDKARRKGADAGREYAALFSRQENPLTDLQLTHYGEMLLLTGQPESAVPVLREVEKTTPRTHYLTGTAFKGLGRWDAAIAAFDSAIHSIGVAGEPVLNSIDCLSALGLAESLIRNNRNAMALQVLEDMLTHCQGRLDEDYPRYPVFEDGYCVDDAQLLVGVCLIRMARIRDGVNALLEADRFYPLLTNGRTAGGMADDLIQMLSNDDTEGLQDAAETLLDAYSEAHGLNGRNAAVRAGR
ncbi:MAG: hypothetical protein QUS35_04090 [bacterium]|nr:hypothetical protein [bacterium]